MTDISEYLKTPESRAWLAMQFVLGELSDEQTAQFDVAMLDDVTLCEAVMEATCLTSGLLLAQEVSRPRTLQTLPFSSRRRRGLVSWIVGGSVVAAMSLGVMTALTESKYSGNLALSSNLVSISTAADLETADAYLELLPEDESLEADDDGDEESVDRDALNDLMAPEWLLTAVELDQQAPAKSPLEGGGVF